MSTGQGQCGYYWGYSGYCWRQCGYFYQFYCVYYKHMIFREESLIIHMWFSYWSSVSRSKWNLEMWVFWREQNRRTMIKITIKESPLCPTNKTPQVSASTDKLRNNIILYLFFTQVKKKIKRPNLRTSLERILQRTKVKKKKKEKSSLPPQKTARSWKTRQGFTALLTKSYPLRRTQSKN